MAIQRYHVRKKEAKDWQMEKLSDKSLSEFEDHSQRRMARDRDMLVELVIWLPVSSA